ncbi:MAG: CBU_0585 family protein [Coxiellaceae bacterium]|nr:CBU_0585 family protein [Coxiellaceae bacterium]
MKALDKQFVSEIDIKLEAFDKNHKKSPSQLAEMSKYQRIHQLRDVPTDQSKERDSLWD